MPEVPVTSQLPVGLPGVQSASSAVFVWGGQLHCMQWRLPEVQCGGKDIAGPACRLCLDALVSTPRQPKDSSWHGCQAHTLGQAAPHLQHCIPAGLALPRCYKKQCPAGPMAKCLHCTCLLPARLCVPVRLCPPAGFVSCYQDALHQPLIMTSCTDLTD